MRWLVCFESFPPNQDNPLVQLFGLFFFVFYSNTHWKDIVRLIDDGCINRKKEKSARTGVGFYFWNISMVTGWKASHLLVPRVQKMRTLKEWQRRKKFPPEHENPWLGCLSFFSNETPCGIIYHLIATLQEVSSLTRKPLVRLFGLFFFLF